MKSSIKIKTDYQSQTRTPIIEILHIKSDDPRDEMIEDFINSICNGGYMCLMEFKDEPSGFKRILKPISPCELTEPLMKWWRDYYKKQDDEKNKIHGTEPPLPFKKSK